MTDIEGNVAQDPSDLFTRALAPGERIVWSDEPQPHGLGSLLGSLVGAGKPTAQRLGMVFGLLWGAFIAVPVVVVVAATGAKDGFDPCFASIAGLIVVMLFFFGHVLAKKGNVAYAVTDRRRGLIVSRSWRGKLRCGAFDLPPTYDIVVEVASPTRGNIDVGIVRVSFGEKVERLYVCFEGVADPEQALVAIREAGAS